jgi:hypothetical protein
VCVRGERARKWPLTRVPCGHCPPQYSRAEKDIVDLAHRDADAEDAKKQKQQKAAGSAKGKKEE